MYTYGLFVQNKHTTTLQIRVVMLCENKANNNAIKVAIQFLAI